MTTYTVYPNGTKTIAVDPTYSIAVYTVGDNFASVYQDVGYPNIPGSWRLIGTVQNVETIYGPFTNGASVRIDAGANAVYYNVALSPAVAVPISDITAGETPFDITGLSDAQGGIVNVTGGTSSTTGNAGGAANLKGGLPGATGIGGTANVVGAIGGASSGAGGDATVTGGAATAAATAGGAVTIAGGLSTTSAAGGAVNVTGGGVGTTGVGGLVAIAGAVSGSSGARNGGAVSVIGGAGHLTSTGVGGVATLKGGAGGGGATGAGGAVVIGGGASVSTADAGGAVGITGGVGTTTGAGGALTAAGGAGGTTGAGGAATWTGGKGGSTSGAAGAATVTAGAGGTGTTTAGGIASLVGGASGTGATGAGGAAKVTGGAALSTNADGGGAVIAGGAKNGSGFIGPVVVGNAQLMPVWYPQAAPAADAGDTSPTVTVAQMVAGLLSGTPTTGRTFTLPTGAEMDAGVAFADVPGTFGFDFTIQNRAAFAATDDIITVAAGATGMTVTGSAVISPGSAGRFRAVRTTTATWIIYKIAG